MSVLSINDFLAELLDKDPEIATLYGSYFTNNKFDEAGCNARIEEKLKFLDIPTANGNDKES